MIYKKIKEAIFIDRPNRFIAQVLIDGQKEAVHVRNTGRCREILREGCQVILEDCGHIPTRKTRYSLIAAYKGDMLINLDSQIPNDVVFQALKDSRLEEIGAVEDLRREFTYKNSRFDMFFRQEGREALLEVKGVTLEEEGLAMFPDAPTKRGSKHIYELIDARENGIDAYIVFLIQMKGPEVFKPFYERDPDFGQALRLAQEKGVVILAYDSLVGPDFIQLDQKIKIDLG